MHKSVHPILLVSQFPPHIIQASTSPKGVRRASDASCAALKEPVEEHLTSAPHANPQDPVYLYIDPYFHLWNTEQKETSYITP
jgi:hypothetical protein